MMESKHEFKNKISEEWIAGFFDGEGCCKVGIQSKKGKTYKHFSILLGQSGEDGKALLEEIQKEYGGNLYHHLKAGQHKATKNAYKLYWNREEGISFLKRIQDKVIMKKKDVDNVLEYMERDNVRI